MRFRNDALIGLLFAVLGACAREAPYTWIDEMRDEPRLQDAGYLISPGDALNVQVWGQEKNSAKVKVRQDGRISLPFIHDVMAANKTPTTLARDVEAKLKDYLVNPSVTVLVEEMAPTSVSVLGEVTKPGVYPVDVHGGGVLQALANAGGLTDFADKNRIFVIRQRNKEKVRFSYQSLTAGGGRAAQFRLQSGDVVVVE